MNLVLVSAALLLAACGDDGGDGSTANDQETADNAIAAVEQALRDDGFAASPDDEDGDELAFKSEECQEFQEVGFAFAGDLQELPGSTASAKSGPFQRGAIEPTGGVEVAGAGAAFVEEPEDLDAFFEMLNDDRFAPCLEEGIRIAFQEDAAERQEAVEVGDFDIEQLDADGLGDASWGIHGTAEITTSGSTFLLSFAYQFVRVDRAVVSVAVVGLGTDEPTADRAALLQILVDGVSDQD